MSGRIALLGLLTLAVVASAVGVVYVQHLRRELFMELNQLEQKRDAMQVEWGQLELEQSTWATHERIEGIASKLGLHMPKASSIVVVTP